MRWMKVHRYPFPKDAKALVAHFAASPYEFTKEEENFLWAAQIQPYLFVMSREDKAAGRGWCSACRKFGEFRPGLIYHKAEEVCPYCKAILTVEHVWRMSKYLYDRSLLYQWRKSEVEPGALVCRAVDVRRPWGMWGKTNGRPDLMKAEADVMSFYVYRPGAGGCQLRPICSGYMVSKRPGPLDYRYRASFMNSVRKCRIDDDFASLMQAAEDSPFRYGMKEYSPWQQDHFLRFFDWSARYPSVEKLVKMGLARLVAERMNGGGGSAVYWAGKTVEKIFRGKLTKEDKRYLLAHGDEVTQDDLSVWQFFRGKMSIKKAAEEKDNQTLGVYSTDLKKIARHVDGFKAAVYLKKQGTEKADKWPWNVRTYADYLADAEKLSMDFSDKNVLFPKDLYRAHQNTIRQVEYKKNEALEVMYAKKRRRKMERQYSFSALGMRIIVPERLVDLIEEGKAQHNCVGGYMERVAKGETDVVFVRRTAHPEKSYITMEIKDDVIYQARSKNNGGLDKKGQAFIEAFQAAKLTKKEEKVRVTA